MALYDLHRSTATPLSTLIATRLSSVFLSVLDRMPSARPRAAEELRRMSDRQLADLGLTRGELDRFQ